MSTSHITFFADDSIPVIETPNNIIRRIAEKFHIPICCEWTLEELATGWFRCDSKIEFEDGKLLLVEKMCDTGIDWCERTDALILNARYHGYEWSVLWYEHFDGQEYPTFGWSPQNLLHHLGRGAEEEAVDGCVWTVTLDELEAALAKSDTLIQLNNAIVATNDGTSNNIDDYSEFATIKEAE